MGGKAVKRNVRVKFWEELGKFRGRFRVCKNGKIRLQRTCPIVAVIGGRGEDVNDDDCAYCGLTPYQGQSVVLAADGEKGETRRRMLKILGLDEVSA